MRSIVGIDIGGTKCAVCNWTKADGMWEDTVFPTCPHPETLEHLAEIVGQMSIRPSVIGIACGGPLNLRRGTIESPPNLPGWDGIPVVEYFQRRFKCGVHLMNDANANALAEWRFGAGRGSRAMIFLTAGTGMGAGIVLNGQLYEGVTGEAGEVGHIRLAEKGPVGFGKAGSFEGFCSGGAIPGLARFLPRPQQPGNLRTWMSQHPTLRDLAVSARRGDPTARNVFLEVGRRFGRGLAALIDVLNPDRIILGSLYVRCRDLFEPAMRAELEKEALPTTLAACRILPAKLGSRVGSYGAICAALHATGRLTDL